MVLCACGHAAFGHGGARLRASLVEPEGRINVGHERGIGDNTEDPPVEPHDEVEDPPWIPRREEQSNRGEEHQEEDQAWATAPSPVVLVPAPLPTEPASAEEDPEEEVVRDREQPPLHEHEPARQLFRI